MSDAEEVDEVAAIESPNLDAICATNLLDAPGAVTFFFKDLLGRFIRVSAGCAELTNRTPESMIGLTDFDLTDRAHATELLIDEQRIIATGESMIDKREVDRLANKAGTLVETSKFPLRDAHGTIVGTFGYSRDVTRWAVAEQRIVRLAQASERAHAQLKLVEAQLREVLDASTDAITRYDGDLRLEYVNPAGARSRGVALEQLIGRTDRESGMPTASLDSWEPALRRVLETGEATGAETCVRSAGTGQDEWFFTTFTPHRDASGAVVGVLTSTRDVSAIKTAEQALVHLATHDPLTGLANRYLLADRLERALLRMKRRPSRLVVMFVDLDGFKDVNDRFGHEVGDKVLVEVARRLEWRSRLQDTVARLGGDEFILLCDGVPAGEWATAMAARIVGALAEPFVVGPLTLELSASVGVVMVDDPESVGPTILRNADSAMYRAKELGKNRFAVFE